MKEEVKIFTYELNHIKDEKIREFTEKALEIAPDYFWHIAASSTAKYHSPSCLGEGGLCRHVKANCMIAIDLLTLPMFKFTDKQKDMIISALLLHDICKSGVPQQKYSIHDHPIVAANYIRQHKEVYDILPKDEAETILLAVEHHMGNFTTAKYSKVVLTEPQTGLEKFVFWADYLGSRRYLTYDFSGEE